MFNDSRSVYELNIQACYDGYIKHFRKNIFTHSEFPSLTINDTLHIFTHPELNSQNIYSVLGDIQIEHSNINDVFIPYKTSCP
jgi:DUF4097 and DUF4098 domain-containing protein YvlB